MLYDITPPDPGEGPRIVTLALAEGRAQNDRTAREVVPPGQEECGR